jgi:hypothetical protein
MRTLKTRESVCARIEAKGQSNDVVDVARFVKT